MFLIILCVFSTMLCAGQTVSLSKLENTSWKLVDYRFLEDITMKFSVSEIIATVKGEYRTRVTHQSFYVSPVIPRVYSESMVGKHTGDSMKYIVRLTPKTKNMEVFEVLHFSPDTLRIKYISTDNEPLVGYDNNFTYTYVRVHE